MIKDIIVNLSRGQDFAADYAVSIAAAFKAHLVGIQPTQLSVITSTLNWYRIERRPVVEFLKQLAGVGAVVHSFHDKRAWCS